jgi:hypothetical protein
VKGLINVWEVDISKHVEKIHKSGWSGYWMIVGGNVKLDEDCVVIGKGYLGGEMRISC